MVGGGVSTVSTVFLRPIVEIAAKLGADRAALLASVGLTAAVLEDREARVPAEVERRLWHEAACATDDPDFGLHIAERAPPGAFDVLDYAAQASPTLGEAFDRVARYQRLMHSGFVLEVVKRPGRVVLQQVSNGVVGFSRHTLEAWAATVVMRGRLFAGLDWNPIEVELSHPAPAQTSEHRRIFRAPVYFDRDAVRLHVDLDLVERRLVTADRRLCEMLDEHACTRLARLPESTALAEHVRALIANAMSGGDPSLSAVSARLHLHPRVVQRRLRDEGTSHQLLLEEARRRLAVELLERSEMAICEVAYLLGYSEASAFHRAFKRWTGSTPAEARSRALRVKPARDLD
jgi:AraC-like DNA-binding protein